MICIAIVSDKSRISGILTKFFTGSPAYHIGFVDTERNKFYDMNLLFRRREWPHYHADKVKLYTCPVPLTADDLEWWLDNDEDWYGVLDYLWFGVSKVFPGKRPSFKGSVCSEKVYEILRWKGWDKEFYDIPSPASFERVLVPI